MTQPSDISSRTRYAEASTGERTPGLPLHDLAGPPPLATSAARPVAEPATEPAVPTESKFERNIIRVLAGGFAFFVALAAITTAIRDGVAGWELSNVVLVLAVFLILALVAVYGLPRDEPSVISEGERRFHELADPTRPLTTDDVSRVRGVSLGPAEPREHEG
ncbi:MAG TPA: hypothetical protein VFS20_13530 [Longimicrobium sp.]|nr:hypothetical protein [Longimicrobium sp.]